MNENNLPEHPDLTKLKRYFRHHAIEIAKDAKGIRDDLFFVNVSIDGYSFSLLIDDECRDFSTQNPLMNWYLVLLALELYDDCEDILEWCKELNVEPVDVLEHYKSLPAIYAKIEEILGEIDPCIPSFDYYLRAGATQELVANRR